MAGSMDEAIKKSNDYIQQHLTIAQTLKKPVVIEEFGFPRDIATWADGTCRMLTPTTCRNQYYQSVFEAIKQSKDTLGWLRGCNFWAWGGEAVPLHQQWLPGDPYTGDPAQEDQGLNSVFLTDTATITLIRQANQQLQ